MDINKYRIAEQRKKININERQTDDNIDGLKGKKTMKSSLQNNCKEISKIQERLYAEKKQSNVFIFQAVDAGGKDGTIQRVFRHINPLGLKCTAFGAPTKEELDHDYLWRASSKLPERGQIGIFNRSYYEEVLVARVHPEILDRQPMLDSLKGENIWQSRFEDIRNYEKYLKNNGVKIVKIFLHISKEEQKRRFIRRIDLLEKNWKFTEDDIKERQFYDSFMDAYGDAIGETSTDFAPWYVVPADRKELARVIVSEIVLRSLEELNPQVPLVSEDRHTRLLEIKKILENENPNENQ